MKPEAWFRLLLRRVPTTPVRLLGGDYRVRALSQLEEASFHDLGESLSASRARARLQREIVSLSLLAGDGEPVFADGDALKRLTEDQIAEVWRVVKEARVIVAPPFTDATIKSLTEGAKHPSNVGVTNVLGACVDVAFGFGASRTSWRPDRFYGVPLVALSPGQWAAFFAALSIVKAQEKEAAA